jgi:hypothetical protein
MTAKGLYPVGIKAGIRGDGMSRMFSSQNKIPFYTLDSFIGRDDGENFRKTLGLTDWVAKNFELLDLGEVPYDSRQVDSLTRARWQQFTEDFLERWMASHTTRHVIRRGMDGRDGPEFMMFPHPDDALGMKLQGRNGELPCARFDITDDGVVKVFAFRSERIAKVESTDLVATIAINEQDAYSSGGWIAAPSEFLQLLNSLDSQIMETENELKDWFAYLEWSEHMHNENAWTGEIVSAQLLQYDPPIASLDLKSSGRSLSLLKRLPWKRGPNSYITKSPSKEEIETASDEAIQALDQKMKIGYVTKSHNQPKNKKIVTVNVRLNQPISSNALEQWIGQTLINDSSDDYGTLNRERKGLERLRDMESPSDMHKWIFDIKNAAPGPLEPPALQYPLFDRLNKEQEWAVRSALAAPDVYFIQGPPGTGKTTVIAELVNQITQDGGRVLVASQTNLAVDNALGRLQTKTNVRPIRWLGKYASIDPDPESKPFLEDHVVQSFFLPSIKSECELAQTEALNLRSAWEAINEFSTEGAAVSHQVESNQKLLSESKQQRAVLLQEQAMAEKKNQDCEEQNNILQQSLGFMERNEWEMIDVSRLIEPLPLDDDDEEEPLSFDIDDDDEEPLDLSTLGGQVKQINELDNEQNKVPILEECLELLNDFDITGVVDPAQAKLRQEMKDAADDLDFDKAKTLKDELEDMEREQSDQANKGWASTSKDIARLGRKLNHDELLILASSLQPPADIDAISEQLRIEFRSEMSTIEDNVHVLEGLKSSAIAEVQLRLERSSSGSTKSESSVHFEQKIAALDEKIILLYRKIKDLNQEYQTLLSPLPEEVRGVADEIAASGKTWQDTHRVRYQNEELWMDLRKDWIEALNDTSESSIDDLKSLYLELVNVHGVTTAQSGSWHWYSEHANEPFDVVIIDEISKATPPEIILPSLLGRKVIWVGDHRQLAPEFNDPRKKTSEDEDTYEDDGKGRFRDMVTTALFERHFIGAHESLKCSLNVQYRMHQQIMSAINPFYEGKLECGHDDEAQKINKQHGISIRKKDSWGLENRGSELINPRRHLYWVDSALTRTNMYCAEEKKGTSYFNTREIELAEHLFEEMNALVGTWKEEVPVEEWANHLHLRHIKNGTLPVAFITFYAAQKSKFVSKAFAGSSNSTENRWEHLNIRVDTVDRFQGAESPIVIVSMVRSDPLRKGGQENLNRLLEQSASPKNVLVNFNANKNQVNIKPPYTGFAKSPNRVNVAFSRAQNLLIVLGNRWAWNGVKVNIKRDDGEWERFAYYKQLMNNTIRGGMLDGRNLL